MDWTVHVDAIGPGPYDPDWAGDIIDSPVMQGRGPALSVSRHELGFTFGVKADDPVTAVRQGVRIVEELVPGMSIVDVSAETVDEQARRLAESNVPDLLGVSEVAEALGVSRQRVSELADSEDFPVPIARLRAGPIWARAQLARFLGNWNRRPGRPPRRRPVA